MPSDASSEGPGGPAPGRQVDPEAARVDELLAQHRHGRATEAESEELALYVRDRPELRPRVDQAAREGVLGEGWLARVERDHQVQKIENSGRARVERGIGLVLVIGGYLLTLATPAVGGAAIAAGFGLLLYSIVRTRLASRASDPYEDVVR